MRSADALARLGLLTAAVAHQLLVKQLKDFLIYRKVLDRSGKAPQKAQLLDMTRDVLRKEGLVVDTPTSDSE